MNTSLAVLPYQTSEGSQANTTAQTSKSSTDLIF